VAIARELPVISENNTPCWWALYIIDKYVGAVLFDAGENETYAVRAVQYGERKGFKYYEATCVWVEQGVSGSWTVPPFSFATGREVVKRNLMLGYALMNLAPPGAPVLLFGVGGMISVHSAREAAVL
jgi:hypothetical protein